MYSLLSGIDLIKNVESQIHFFFSLPEGAWLRSLLTTNVYQIYQSKILVWEMCFIKLKYIVIWKMLNDIQFQLNSLHLN